MKATLFLYKKYYSRGEYMESEIFKYVITQGVFCVLFVWLLMDTRKDSKEREVKYQETIDKLVGSIGAIEDIKEDVEDIKEIILK